MIAGLSRRLALAAMLSASLALPALAHHGWAWTEDGFFELTGTVAAIYYGNPHPTLDVEANGETWHPRAPRRMQASWKIPPRSATR